MFMAIFEGKLGDARFIEFAQSFCDHAVALGLKVLENPSNAKIDFWGETPSLEKNSQQPLPCWLTSVPLRTVSLREGRGVGGILKF